MRRGLKTWGLLCLAPLCTAWVGSGAGTADWVAGESKARLGHGRVAAEAVIRFEPFADSQLVITLPLPDVEGDAVLGLTLNDRGRGVGPISLPDRGVTVTYREYGPDGEILFEGRDEAAGSVRVEGPADGPLWVDLDMDLIDRVTPEVWRRVEGLRLELRPVSPPIPEERASGVAPAPVPSGGGGCDSGWDEGPYQDDPGADWGGGSDSGCEGDGGGSSSGCAGDDLSGADAGGCEGDAIAGQGPHARRSPWLLRLLNWSPWLLCLLAIRLMRRRRSFGR